MIASQTSFGETGSIANGTFHVDRAFPFQMFVDAKLTERVVTGRDDRRDHHLKTYAAMVGGTKLLETGLEQLELVHLH